MGTGCPPKCSAHGCPQDKAEFKDKLSPVALSVALTLPGEAPGLVLYGDTLVQAQVGGTWLWGDVTVVTRGGLIPTAGPGHIGVPPAWVCSAPGLPACASVPNTPMGHCTCPPHCPPFPPGCGSYPPHCPSFPLECAPHCPCHSLACPSHSALCAHPAVPNPSLGSPFCTQHRPHSHRENVPSAIPNPSPGCPPVPPAVPSDSLSHTSPWMGGPPVPSLSPPRPTSSWRTVAMTTSVSPTSTWPPTREHCGGGEGVLGVPAGC